jgi:hypothetical protein
LAQWSKLFPPLVRHTGVRQTSAIVTGRKRHKAQISRRRRTVCDLLESAYIRGSKAKERRREGGERKRGQLYIIAATHVRTPGLVYRLLPGVNVRVSESGDDEIVTAVITTLSPSLLLSSLALDSSY